LANQPVVEARVHSESPDDFGRALSARPSGRGRVELDREKVQKGLMRLVLTLLRLVHELLERQAIRRMDSNTLSEEQMEELGATLRAQGEQIQRLGELVGLSKEELNLDLGPLGRLFHERPEK
jgi:hypothetical protein